MKNPIVVVEYEPSWPERFEAEKVRLLEAVSWALERVEHIGSTAVCGLASKPILDIMGALRSLEDAMQCVESLRAVGYEYVPEFEKALPMRRFFRRVEGGVATHHLHLVKLESDFWREHLAFRDWLRSHPETADEYATLKRKLAERFRHDREGYTGAKAEFIRIVLGEAMHNSTRFKQ